MILTAVAAMMITSTTSIFAAGWTNNAKQAIAMSKKTGKPILADFTGSDWCGWCIKLKKEVFNTPTFQKWASENVVLLEVDFPSRKPQSDALKKQNQTLAQQFRVKGYPTIVFFDAKGKELGRSGYRAGGPSAWIQNAQKIVGTRQAAKTTKPLSTILIRA